MFFFFLLLVCFLTRRPRFHLDDFFLVQFSSASLLHSAVVTDLANLPANQEPAEQPLLIFNFTVFAKVAAACQIKTGGKLGFQTHQGDEVRT